MSEPDLQTLAKLPPQADPAVERAIMSLLKAYGTHRERLSAGTSSEAPCNDVCAICGAPGVPGNRLQPCSAKGEYFLAHPRCFNARYA